MDNPDLSIYVPTFNHQDYILQALDSILMQETSYSYEVHVGEDCSTDNTRQVLKDWEAKHPGVFHIYYRERNMYNSIPSNHFDLIGRCCGKYIICLEGDDYWTDPHKIDKQIRFLEEHPDYIAVAHNCAVVDHDSKAKCEEYPQCLDEEYTWKHYFRGILPGQLTTVMYRNVHHDCSIDTDLFEKPLTPGDRVLYFLLLSNGRVHCIQETMSAYRHVTDRGSSYSATVRYRFETEEQLYAALMQYAKEKQKHREVQIVAQQLYFRSLVTGMRAGQCRAGQAWNYFKNLDYKSKALTGYIKYRLYMKFTRVRVIFEKRSKV